MFSTCFRLIIKSEFDCNMDREQLRQINEGLFCCRENAVSAACYAKELAVSCSLNGYAVVAWSAGLMK